MPTHPMPCWPHSTPGPSSPRPGVSASHKSSRAGAVPRGLEHSLCLSQGHAWCQALDRVGLPRREMAGQGLQAEGPYLQGQGPRQAMVRGGRTWGREGWQCHLPKPLLPQTTNQQLRFRIHTSVHHNTDKFPPFDCLRKISRVLTWGPIHPRVPGPSLTDATRPSPALPSWPEGAHCPTPQPVWAPQGWRLCTGHGVPPRERPSSTSAPRDAALPK